MKDRNGKEKITPNTYPEGYRDILGYLAKYYWILRHLLLDTLPFIIGYFAIYYWILEQLSYGWFPELLFAAQPRIVDVYPEVVNAFAFFQADEERQE